MTTNAQAPLFRYLSASGSVQSITFGPSGQTQRMGAMYLYNGGPAVVFFNFDSAVPTGALGNGQFGVPVGLAVNLDDIVYERINVITGGGTADVQVIGTVRGA